ncbi:hypothetical protein K466DRAFT_605231 [Polyporus arcularius HHB13444]|uniref:Uncharacterized protein n=1 Tax=Polyporus arcularius HHB13444 TaxID=1314778 RepID=A0A5C3NTJ6_9APHY|nr:hypothetical protein K466DRAFT_605231 [Polyporus arcularius HHB13444]
MGRVLVAATPVQKTNDYMDDVPVASDDEGTIDGGQKAVAKDGETNGSQDRQTSEESSTLPSSTPIRFPSTDLSGDDLEDADGQTVGTDSSPLWRAVGSLPRETSSQAFVQFDESESRNFEDGEVDEATPPCNQQAAGSDTRGHFQDLDGYMGKQYSTPPRREPQPTRLKRSWEGSQGSEERSRTARRPRRDETAPMQPPVQLPPITELMTNPWGGARGFGGARRIISQPVACSTPKNVSQYGTPNHHSPFSHYSYDSQANVSGRPPTPHSRANTTADRSFSQYSGDYKDDEGRTTHEDAWNGQEDGMRVDDLDEDEEASALLRTPPGVNARRGHASTNDLHQTLANPPSMTNSSRRAGDDQRWRGGYAPRHWDSDARGPDGRQRVPAVEDWGMDGDGSGHEATFSPIPYTKAWQYQQDLRRRETKREQAGREQDRRAYGDSTGRYSRTAGSNAFEAGQDSADARTHGDDATRQRRGGRAESWNDGRVNEARMDLQEDWQDVEMVPTAVARGPAAADVPTLADDPQDRRWEVHYDDPERLVCGQSDDWQRELWKDSTVVMFTAYNYRYTTNGVVNRHVESAVTSITAFVTGETNFNVVPPDPDRVNTVNVRDLPFTWGIRGLSADGAARMTAAQVASTKDVSIIIYPKRLENPRWICSLVGFLRPDAGVIRAAVMDVLSTPSMHDWLDKMTRASTSLRRIPAENRVEYVLNSLEVRIADLEDDDFMANIYMIPPTDSMTEWRAWVAHLRTQRFNNFLNGSGVARRIV